MRAQSLGIPSVLEDAWGPGCVWLGVLPGAKAPRDDVTMWWNRVDIVPNVPTCPGTGLMSYRSYRSVRYRYRRCTGTGSGTYVHTGTAGTGIDVVPNLPNCPVPVLISNLPKCTIPVLTSHRTYRSVRYRYGCRTELTEVSGTGIDAVPNIPKCRVPVIPAVYIAGTPRYVPYRTHTPLKYYQY